MARSLRTTLSLVASLAALVPATAYGQADADRATARQLGGQGEAALVAGDWKTAEDDFRRADSLFHAPSLVLGLARAQSHEGKVVEAWENYHRIILENVQTAPAFVQALHDANTEIAAVEVRRSRLTLSVTGTDAPRVTIDSVPIKVAALGVERPTNPGHHTIAVEADGWKPVTRDVTLVEGKGEVVTIALEKDPAATATVAAAATPATTSAPGGDATATSPSSLNKTLGVVGLGVGGAGLITGVIAGIFALSDHSKLKTDCPNGTCSSSSAQSELSTYHTAGTVSTVGFIVGGVAAAGGAVLLLTAPKGSSSSSTAVNVTPYVGLGTLGAVGRF